MYEVTDELIREVVNPPPISESNDAEAAHAAMLVEYDREHVTCAL